TGITPGRASWRRAPRRGPTSASTSGGRTAAPGASGRSLPHRPPGRKGTARRGPAGATARPGVALPTRPRRSETLVPPGRPAPPRTHPPEQTGQEPRLNGRDQPDPAGRDGGRLVAPRPGVDRGDPHHPGGILLMSERHIGAAPVIDRAGRPVGVVSHSDILA